MGSKRVKKSRREFFKTAALLAGGAAAATVMKPFTGVVYASTPTTEDGPWWGIGIDITKCIGCGRCGDACKAENDVPREPFFFRTWIEEYTVKNDGEVVVRAPNGGTDGFDAVIPEEDIFKSFFVPKMCNHCHKSPCVQVCPVGATYDSPDGIVLVDDEYCIGCRYCIQACPYGCRYIHPERQVVDKCTLCYHRVQKGLAPACVEMCPTKARIYGDLRDKNSEIVQFLKDNICQVLKPHLNTGSKLFYNGLSAEVR